VTRALKYPGEDGHVTIRVHAENDHEFRIEVETRASGFDPTMWIGSSSNSSSSTPGRRLRIRAPALGLALTRRIVEAQGGRVGVRSTSRRGQRLSAILPKNGAAA
jgi:signal transduction histidine kinase